MSITVKFFGDHGDLIESRKFAKGQRINVNVIPVGLSGLPSIGTLVRCDGIAGTSNFFSKQDTTNVWGYANFQFALPNKDTRATIHLYAEYSVTGSDSLDIPIAVGNSVEPKPITEESGIVWWVYPLAILAIGLAVIGGYKARQLLNR